MESVTQQFEEIYSETCRQIYYMAVAGARTLHDAEDIFQETYVELLNELNKGRKFESTHAYLKTILRRKLSEHYKGLTQTEQIAEFLINFDSNDDPIDDLDIEDSIITDSLYEEVISLLKGKDDLTQRIFYLYYSLDRSLSETAAELDMPISTVKNKLYRTLKEFRKHYKEGIQ